MNIAKLIAVSMLCCTPLMSIGCSKSATDDGGKKGDENLPEIEIPAGDVTVAVYYFPNWGPVSNSEWGTLQNATPKFAGHQQPKVPMWGYKNENRPENMEPKIAAAADNGVDVFIFDWYFYDNDKMPGNKYLYMALEDAYLKSSNNNRVKFSIMWCNHDLGDIAKGAVKPETVDLMMDYVIEKYFKHPSYWLIDGCPYFSIYETHSFLKTFDNDYAKAAAALDRFRTKVKAAGFPDLHLNCVLWGLSGTVKPDEAIANLKIQSSTSYVWIHHVAPPDFPTTIYEKVAKGYMNAVKNGGASNGLENNAAYLGIPYHINVTMGWDSSPRCGPVAPSEWMSRRDYPFGAVLTKNTPYMFKKYLAQAKAWTMEKPEKDRIVVINSWNEWGEGSYIEPDIVNGMGYLEAVKDVFGANK